MVIHDSVFQGGIFFFQLMDHYVASMAVIFLAFFEVVAISWFFGVGRLTRAINQMSGRKVSLYFRSCWLFFIPILLFVSILLRPLSLKLSVLYRLLSFQSIFVFAIVNYKHPTYHNGQYEYPGWAHGLGWSIVSLALMCIPCYGMITLARSEGDTLSEVNDPSFAFSSSLTLFLTPSPLQAPILDLKHIF